MRPSYLVSLLPLLLAACQAGTPATPAEPDAADPPAAVGLAAATSGASAALDEAARVALTTLLDRAARGEARLSGLPAREEAASARLGEPLPVSMVRLDRLKAHRPGAPAESLIDKLDLAIYPVQVGADVRAELEMSRVDGAWQAVSVGGTGHARTVADLRARSARGEAPFLLRVPALGVEFIAEARPEGLTLTPLFARAGASLEAGKALPAAEVFKRLVPLALAHNGDLG